MLGVLLRRNVTSEAPGDNTDCVRLQGRARTNTDVASAVPLSKQYVYKHQMVSFLQDQDVSGAMKGSS